MTDGWMEDGWGMYVCIYYVILYGQRWCQFHEDNVLLFGLENVSPTPFEI